MEHWGLCILHGVFETKYIIWSIGDYAYYMEYWGLTAFYMETNPGICPVVLKVVTSHSFFHSGNQLKSQAIVISDSKHYIMFV